MKKSKTSMKTTIKPERNQIPKSNNTTQVNVDAQSKDTNLAPKNGKKKRNPNKEILRITYIFLLVFILMIGYFISFYIEDSQDIINNTYNRRQNILEAEITRGNILSSDGQILATTITTENGTEQRHYPFNNLFAHAVGYSTHGTSGIELLANYKLLTSNASIVETAIHDFTGKKDPGNHVQTSLNVEMTKAAYDALGTRNGAVIAIESATGKILTMVSKPDFNPNEINKVWDSMVNDAQNSNLLNRTTSGTYTPGSTFKLFTLLEYLHEQPDYSAYTYDCSGSITIGEHRMHCANHIRHGHETLLTSFANSCNTSFVNLGLSLDKLAFKKLCNRLLFNAKLPIDYAYKQSSYVLEEQADAFNTMQTVIGQGETLVTPVHLAMIAAAIQNHGILMKPYVISGLIDAKGKQLETYRPELYQTLFTEAETTVLREFLRSVITDGTAKQLNSDHYTAYGKTGTAQINDGSKYNSLFLGFAEQGAKTIAICVVIENVQDNDSNAAMIAKQVFDVYYR